MWGLLGTTGERLVTVSLEDAVCWVARALSRVVLKRPSTTSFGRLGYSSITCFWQTLGNKQTRRCLYWLIRANLDSTHASSCQSGVYTPGEQCESISG